MSDEREIGGWRRGRLRPIRRSGTPSSRLQFEELRSGERVTEPGRPGARPMTGPAVARWLLMNNLG